MARTQQEGLMKIAIIGAGRVGTTLGAQFQRAGHHVVYGARTPDSPKYAGIGTVATISDAAAAADVVVLTTPWAGAQEALEGAGDLTGKVLVDATNPIGPGMVLTHGTTDSGAEQVARWAPGARVVKAFNSIGMEVMANPVFANGRSVLWMSGDDADACAQVAELATSIGFEPVRLGPLARARFQEPAALVWITASATLGREFSWGILRR
ncbi:NAD(P)-binding domain-containing protein [Gemmatimonas sp.]|uniref:NADPH-dependent F420 reductase n=1 Tax=Gemmatimonas sp. TaxID=1962908 RepID=UPI0022BEB641|nr:NAD(P)-binding domain-containing protein [Gemmatimonas sp.]MCZ8012877.1 NAD(P)-binding domain-containing protein [Gemmatimonas sp.]MCZ8268252.1 NAD(P)-binding domain-containing protein [Gemmatimonas sp.]